MLGGSIPYSFFALGIVKRFVYKQNLLEGMNSLEELGRKILEYVDPRESKQWLDEGENCDRIYREKGVEFIDIFHPHYPPLLRFIFDPPLVLYALGNTEILSGRFWSIVGTRKASPVALFASRLLVRSLSCSEANVKESLGIVSGMALGIDKEAMQTSLDMGLPTVGVLGTPVYKEYPYANKNLFMKIKKSSTGVLLSELLPYDNYAKWTFPMRNRIITGISESVYLMETPEKSGAMSSANNAIQQNKDLFVFQHPYLYRNGGGDGLVNEGAESIQLRDMGFRGEIVHSESLIQKDPRDPLSTLASLKAREANQEAESLGDGFYCIF